MEKRTRDFLVASLAVSATAVSLYFAFTTRSPKINLDSYEVLGAVTAEETAKLVGNNGQVLVMVRDTGADKNPSVESELKAFQQTLKKYSGLRVITEKIQVTPMLMMSTGGGVPPDQLLKACRTHPNIAAIVLFFGFPELADGEIEALKQSKVKIIVVSAFRPGYERLLERQAFHLAIVPRPNASLPTAKVPRTMRERFDQEYIVLTPSRSNNAH
jgi:hypothetical protein